MKRLNYIFHSFIYFKSLFEINNNNNNNNNNKS